MLCEVLEILKISTFVLVKVRCSCLKLGKIIYLVRYNVYEDVKY